MAENGKVAVEMFKSGNFDLVLIGIQLPVMEGYAATGEIRGWGRETNLEETPIIALTAQAMAEDARRSLAAGRMKHLA